MAAQGGDNDELARTATIPAGAVPRPEVPPREPAPSGIDSPDQDLAELPVIDPETYVFGRYFARGGMGRIAEVRDKRLGRVVAIKELIVNDPGLVRRFQREIRITAQLQHPAIVSMLEAGRWPTGEPFFAMKLVAGQSLKQAIEQRKTLDERLGLVTSVIAISDALAYAHEHGIIHRDLKPANVLVGEFGETVVIDWGLAKDLRRADDDDDDDELPAGVTGSDDRTAQMTAAGSILGTPAYMSPEQARGDDVDERTDVYALGVILYNVLTGAPPYDAQDAAALMAKVLTEAPVPIGERQPGVPDDLQTIVARAMARDPAARYPSAKQLAADLKRFQTGQLVAAHKYTRRELIVRWFRRYRATVLVGLGAVLALIALGTASITGIVRERDRARAAEGEASARADALVIAQARATVANHPLDALRWLADLRLSSVQWPAARLIAADAMTRGVPRIVATIPEDAADFALSPDGRQIAVAGPDHQLRIIDRDTGATRVIGGHAARINDVEFSRDGGRVATASQDNTIIVWKTTGEQLQTFRGHQGWVIGVEFSPNGSQVISTSLDQTTRIWPLGAAPDAAARVIPTLLRARTLSADGSIMAGRDGQGVAVWDVASSTRRLSVDGARAWALSPTGTQLATADGAVVRLHDPATGTIRTLGEAHSRLTELAFSATGDLVVGTGRDGTVHAWDVRANTSWTYRGAIERIDGLVLSPDDAWIAVWTEAGDVHLVDVRTHAGRRLAGANGEAYFTADSAGVMAMDAQRRVLAWSTSVGAARTFGAGVDVRAIAVTPDGATVVSGGPGSTVRIVDLKSGQTRDLAGHQAHVAWTAVSPYGALAVSLDLDKQVRLWELATGKTVKLGGRGVAMVTFSPDGNHLAAPGDDESVRVWSVATGVVRSLAGHAGWVSAVAFSPDSGRLASVGSDGTVRIWNVATGIGQILGTHEGVRRATFSPDGAWLATAGEDGMVRLWSGTVGDVRVLSGHTGWVLSIAFAPDGRTLASAGSDKTVRIWTVASAVGRVLGSHDDAVLQIGFSPDGTTVASASVDGTARLWDVVTADHRSLRGHTSWVTSVVFLPGAKHVVTHGHDGTLRVWPDDLPRDPSALQQWLERAAGATPATPARPR